MSKHMKTVIFAAALCTVCSILLTAANTGLKAFQQSNIEVDRHKNILLALGLIEEGQRVESRQIQTLYDTRIRSLYVDRKGRIKPEQDPQQYNLPLYVHVDEEQIQAYAVPINTRGLWGKIHGYLAIRNDGATIAGFTVYKHSETPGLGGEIESRWFRKNFVNKKIINAQGDFVSIRVAKGVVDEVIAPASRPNHVDGISGATMTGQFLSSGLKDILRDYEPMAIEFRQKNPRYLRVQQ